MASWDFLTVNSAVVCFLLITSLPSLLVQAKESNSCRPEVSTSSQLESYFLVKLIHLQLCFYFSVQKKESIKYWNQHYYHWLIDYHSTYRASTNQLALLCLSKWLDGFTAVFGCWRRVTRGQKERDLKLAALYVNQVDNASDDGW